MTSGRLPSGATTVGAVIGDPIDHSLSPVIHNRAFGVAGLDWVFVAFRVPSGGARAALDAMRVLRLGGLSVTMPHKAAVAEAVDRLSPEAEALGAVNCVRRDGDLLVGENTDGAGFLDAVGAEAGFDPKGRRCVVVGAGGAGRAVIRALAEAGADEVVVVNRTPERGTEAAQLAERARTGAPEDAADADLVVNATPLGMAGVADAGLPLDPSLLRAGQVVVDLVYEPRRTPLLAAAEERGAVAVGGIGMLVHQAALAFEHWTGAPPPIEAMREAALMALRAGAHRGAGGDPNPAGQR